MEKTRRLMREDSRSVPELYAALHNSGSSITFYWLRKFHSGEVIDPSVNRVEEVYEFLTGRSLIDA